VPPGDRSVVRPGGIGRMGWLLKVGDFGQNELFIKQVGCVNTGAAPSFHWSETSPDRHRVVSFSPVSSMAVSFGVWDAQLLVRRPAFRFS